MIWAIVLFGVQARSREANERVSSVVDPWGNVASDVPASQLLQQQHDQGASFVDTMRSPAQLTSLEVKVSGQTAQHVFESDAVRTMPMSDSNLDFLNLPKLPDMLAKPLGGYSKEKQEKNHREKKEAARAESTTSSLVTFMLFGFLFLNFTILGLLNSDDLQVRCYSYKLLSTCIVVFCALAVNQVQHKFFHWMLEKMELHGCLETILLFVFVCWFFSINFTGYHLRASHEDRFAAMGLLEHVAAFVLMEMLAEMQEYQAEEYEHAGHGHEESIVMVGDLRLDMIRLYVAYPFMVAAFIRCWQFVTFFLRRYLAAKHLRQEEEEARAAAAAQPPPPPTLPPPAPAAPPQPVSRLGFSGRGRSSDDGARGVGFATGSSTIAEATAAPEKPKPEAEAPPKATTAVEPLLPEFVMAMNLAKRCCGGGASEAAPRSQIVVVEEEGDPMAGSWQEEVGESEFTTSAIVTGFFMKQLIVYCTTSHPPPLDCTAFPIKCLLPPEQMVYLAAPMVMFYLMGIRISLREKSEEVNKKNTVLESLQVHLSMTFSWLLMHWSECCVFKLIDISSGTNSILNGHTVKKLFTAAALSPMLVLVIIWLDKLADRGLLDSTSAEASVDCVAFVVGLAWEKVFASAITNMSAQLGESKNLWFQPGPVLPDLALSLLLLYTMLPGWRRFLVPTASQPVPERDVEEEPCKS